MCENMYRMGERMSYLWYQNENKKSQNKRKRKRQMKNDIKVENSEEMKR